jgi:hypothetical protein
VTGQSEIIGEDNELEIQETPDVHITVLRQNSFFPGKPAFALKVFNQLDERDPSTSQRVICLA